MSSWMGRLSEKESFRLTQTQVGTRRKRCSHHSEAHSVDLLTAFKGSSLQTTRKKESAFEYTEEANSEVGRSQLRDNTS